MNMKRNLFLLVVLIGVMVANIVITNSHNLPVSMSFTLNDVESLAQNENSSVCGSYVNSYDVEDISSSGAYAIIIGYDCTKGSAGMCQKGKIFYFHKSTGEPMGEDDQRVSAYCL